MITEESIEKVKDKIDLVGVIKEFVTLKTKGSDQLGLCPFHTEHTPSFRVSKAKGMFKCFGCGKQGDAIDFIKEHKSLSYIEAIKFLADKYHVELEEVKPKKDYAKPEARVQKVSDSTLSYFENQRKITNYTLVRFKVTESVEWMPVHQSEVPAICFNYYRGEELINIKFRAAKKDFKLVKDAELIFYNLNSLENQTDCVIVEGEIDAMSIYEAGIYNVISVPNGAAKGHQKLEYIENCWEDLAGMKKITIMADNDEPGRLLTEELARRLGIERCFKVEYPADCKDANDILVKHGKELLKSTVDQAKQWPIDGVYEMMDLYNDVLSYYQNGYPEGYKVGLPHFDELCSFMQGQYTTVTGIPGSGKSEFIDLIMCLLAKKHGWSFGVCSFENQPAGIHVSKLMEKMTGKSFAFRKNPYNRMSQDDFDRSVDDVASNFYFINITKVDVTLQGLLNKAKELVERKGIKGLLIDPWNYIEHKIPGGYTETQYISESLTLIKSFALKMGIHIFLIAHPTKVPKDKATGKYEIPTMYSISGSAHFFNKTDIGMTVYRDFENNLVTVYINKMRYPWLGKTGFASFTYNTETRQYKPEGDNSIPPDGYTPVITDDEKLF